MLDNNLKKINLDGQESPAQPIINQYSPEKPANMINKLLPFIIVIVLGIGTGFISHSLFPWNAKASGGRITAPQVTGDAAGLKEGDVVGIEDENAADEAIGILQSGGFEGEGSHHLIRPGGSAQTVYLTSSVVDLDQFVGHKVTIWGETFSAQKAGWLMDVVKVKLEELNAQTSEE